MKKPDWKTWLENKAECKTWFEYYKKHNMLRINYINPENHLKKAIHNIDFSNWLNDKNQNEVPSLFNGQKFDDWTITGYYYAVYHASLALLASKGMSSKSHFATLSAIILLFYHENKINKEDIEILAESIGTAISRDDIEIIIESKSLRERASYGIGYEFDVSLVEKARENAVKFINKSKDILRI